MRFTKTGAIYVAEYDSTDLGITPGTTNVNATAVNFTVPFNMGRAWSLEVNYTLNGNTLGITYQVLRYDGTAMGNSQAISTAGGTRANLWWDGWTLGSTYGQYDVLGVGSGSLNTAGAHQPVAAASLKFTLSRAAGATNINLGVTNLILKGN
jgi:hypothetical protein